MLVFQSTDEPRSLTSPPLGVHSCQSSAIRVSGQSFDKHDTLNEAPDSVRRGHKQTKKCKNPQEFLRKLLFSLFSQKYNMLNHLILLLKFY